MGSRFLEFLLPQTTVLVVGWLFWGCFFQGGVLSRSRLSQYLRYLGMKRKIVTHLR